MNGKIGKPKKYSLDELRQLLLNYVSKYPNTTVTYSSLERETGISRNTWSRNLKNEISRINKPIPIATNYDSESALPLPNIQEIIEKNYDNKEKLISTLSHLNQCVHSLYTLIRKKEEIEYENNLLKTELKQLKQSFNEKEMEISELKSQVSFYSQAYRNIVATASYGDNNLTNVLEFKAASKQKEEKISADLSKQFKMFSSD